ncbi:MAG: FliI/YscN family ATPase [Leptospirillia bacterium]
MTTPLVDISRRVTGFSPTGTVRSYGQLTRGFGLMLEGRGLAAAVGDMVEVVSAEGHMIVTAEVVGFREDRILMMPLGPSEGVGPGTWIRPLGRVPSVAVGEGLLGRVLDGMGHPIDGGEMPVPDVSGRVPLYGRPVGPMNRRRIRQPIATGVRVLDSLISVGEGQRMGVFAGGGVGKSKLLGMIAASSAADINVIALIGERGREVREFIERELGPEGLARSVVVAATSDQAPLVRLRGAYVATAIAEFFRDRGASVMLMMDSVTRFAMAQREVGLSIGEPPATKGYTPSVFAAIPALLERAGMGAEGSGSITGIYTVLVEGDDLGDPVADTLRATLDGHVVLSREIAATGHYPAVDVSRSVSRVMVDVVEPAHTEAAQKIRNLLGIYEEARDLITIGAYKAGNRPELDRAVELYDEISAFLTQSEHQPSSWDEARAGLYALAKKVTQ